MLIQEGKNKLHKIMQDVYYGDFDNVPARSGDVKLILGGGQFDAEVCFVYGWDIGADFLLFSKQGLIDYLEGWITDNRLHDSQYPNPEGNIHTGLELLLEEVKRVYSEQ